MLAAAIHAGASVIVTFNLADFPAAVLASFGVQAEHPDDFIYKLIAVEPIRVSEAAERQRTRLRKPPYSRTAYFQTLRRQGLPQTIAALEKLLPPDV